MLFTMFGYSSLLFYYTNAPVVDMREEPQQNAKIASQAYYSEQVVPLEEKGDWLKIKTTVDNYEGWAKKDSIIERNEQSLTPNETIAKVSRVAAHLYGEEDTERGPILTLPFESQLVVVEEIPSSNRRWIKVETVDGKEGYIQRGDVALDTAPITNEEMVELSQQFLGLPYTWGGRSSFGYDCSGFVQMLYRQMGIFLPRDSKDQACWEGFTPVSFENLQPGDLIFFGKTENKVTHVGMYLGDNKFIHSSTAENRPYLRVNSLDDPTWNGTGTYVFRTARTLKD